MCVYLKVTDKGKYILPVEYIAGITVMARITNNLVRTVPDIFPLHVPAVDSGMAFQEHRHSRQFIDHLEIIYLHIT